MTAALPIKATIAALLLGACVATQAQTPPPAAPTTPMALKAARLFDSTTGTLRTNGVVVVQGDRIVAAGSGTAIPSGAKVIDLGDATLIAGSSTRTRTSRRSSTRTTTAACTTTS